MSQSPTKPDEKDKTPNPPKIEWGKWHVKKRKKHVKWQDKDSNGPKPKEEHGQQNP